MRRCLRDVTVITSHVVETEIGKSGGQVIGVSLGWDYCAEHEWGIAGILRAFGLPDKPQDGIVGADARTIVKVSDRLKFFGNLEGFAYLMFSYLSLWEKPENFVAKNLNRILGLHDDDKEEELSTAWSGNDFGVRIKNKDAFNIGTIVLGQIHDAFTKCDGMIFLSGRSNPYQGSALVLSIRSRMPADLLEQMRIADEEYLNLRK